MPTAATERIRSEQNGISLPAELLDAIRQFETCTIADAIERWGVRLRNEGFTRPGLRCLTGGSPRSLGYAATYRVRSSEPPIKGTCYSDPPDCWTAPEALPTPRIAVIQDMEAEPLGSVAGEVHAAILKAFGCEAILTNGAVRHLEGISRMGVNVFGRHPAVSHAYAHVLDRGVPVNIFGMQIHSGDLVYADCHGAVAIPLEIAADLPRIASEIQAEERRIVELCQSPEFSLERLRGVIDSPRPR